MLIFFFVRIEFFRRVGSPACTMRSISSGPKCGGHKCATNKTRTTDTAKCEYSSDPTFVSFCVSAIQLENGTNHSRIFFSAVRITSILEGHGELRHVFETCVQTLTCVTIDRIIGLPSTNLVLQNIYIHENVPDQIV